MANCGERQYGGCAVPSKNIHGLAKNISRVKVGTLKFVVMVSSNLCFLNYGTLALDESFTKILKT